MAICISFNGIGWIAEVISSMGTKKLAGQHHSYDRARESALAWWCAMTNDNPQPLQ